MRHAALAALLIAVLACPAAARDARPAPRRPGPAAPAAGTASFVVAVLGDRFGDALAEGLRADLGTDPGIAIEAAAGVPRGLAGGTPFDWPAGIATLLAGGRIGAAVVMLGADDLKPIRDGATAADPLTPAWRTLYGDRASALATAVRAQGVPLIWVGLPIVADAETAAAYAEINEIVRDRAVKAGATYVDSWNAFADEGGRYDAMGPDRDGRTTRLRTGDGRDFTRAGAIKLAGFVEGELRRDLAERLAATASTTNVVLPSEPELDTDINAQIRRELGLPPAAGARAADGGKGEASGPVILVTAPPVAPDGRLAAAPPAPVPLPGLGGGSLAERIMVEGRPLPPRAGRLDDFSWPRP